MRLSIWNSGFPKLRTTSLRGETVRMGEASTTTSFLSFSSLSISKPRPLISSLRWIGLSPRETYKPVTPCLTAPLYKNWIPKIVFPDPGPPQTSMQRPLGRPPPNMSSKPLTPVGTLNILLTPDEEEVIWFITEMIYESQILTGIARPHFTQNIKNSSTWNYNTKGCSQMM